MQVDFFKLLTDDEALVFEFHFGPGMRKVQLHGILHEFPASQNQRNGG